MLHEWIEEWRWCQDFLNLSPDFIPLTPGEGEGVVVWSKRDGKVYDIGWSEGDALNRGDIYARWNTYYELMEHYLFGGD